MTGVEILATQEVVVENIFNWTAFWETVGGVFGTFVLLGIVLGLVEVWSYLPVLTVWGVVLGLVCGFITGSAFSTPTEYETQYKVTISDEVFMNDFLERYEIIDQEGKMYYQPYHKPFQTIKTDYKGAQW